MMDHIHRFLNINLIILLTVLLVAVLPALSVYRILRFCIRSVFPEKLAGKVVLITGASSGIGEHLAYEYAKHGASLALVARREELLGLVAAKAKKLGSPDAIIIKADVSKLEDCKRFVDETVDYFGKLDYLVNNAGIGRPGLFEELRLITNHTSTMANLRWLPKDSVERCAKSIVNGARRGEDYLTEPQWMKPIFVSITLIPDLMNLVRRIILVTKK